MKKEFDSREVLKAFLKEQNETLVHVVEMLNAKNPTKQTSAQNLTNKLMRNTIKFSEIMEIVDVLGFEIYFRKKDDSDGYALPKAELKEIDENQMQLTAIVNRVNVPFVVCSGSYYKSILIVGDRCNEAAESLNLRATKENEEDEKKRMLAEILLCAYLENAFDVVIYPTNN